MAPSPLSFSSTHTSLDPAVVRVAGRSLPQRFLRTKDLDFLILAGCSCLLTFLYHPALDQIHSGSSKTSTHPSGSTSRSASSSTSANLGSYSAVVPKRQRFQIEEQDS